MSALRDYRPKWTEAEYLYFERASNVKHEFVDGVVIAMAGASREHNLLSGNTFASLHAQLRKRPCEVFQADLRVKFGTTHSYPDGVAVCGERKMLDDKGDTLLNPTLIIEVLSPSTEQYDRVSKRYEYQKLDSLQDSVNHGLDSPHPPTPSPLHGEGEFPHRLPPLHAVERGLGGEVPENVSSAQARDEG